MINFKCDTCGSETDFFHISKNNGECIPKNWTTLSSVTIHNEHHERAIVYAGNVTMHFCTKKCLIDRFFKPK